MPTVTKLAALVLFAVLAMLGGEWYMALLDDPPQSMRAEVLLGVIGAATGWMFVGKRMTGKPLYGVWLALQGVLLTVLWALLVVSVMGIFQRGYGRRYDGIMDALVGGFGIALEHGARMLAPEFLLRIGVGGIICGLLLVVVFRMAEARRLER